MTSVVQVNRTVRVVLRRIQKTSKPPPKIERVSEDEVWLLGDDGKRMRRICGVQLKRLPAGYVCLSRAGAGTEHKRHGKCKCHHGNVFMQRSTMLRMLQERNIAGVIDSMKQAAEMSDEEVGSVDNEIKVQVGLVNEIFKLVEAKVASPDPKDKLNLVDIRMLETSIAKLSALKERRARIKALDKVTVKEVREYLAFVVGWFFGYVKSFGERELYRRMIVAFDKEVKDQLGADVVDAEVIDVESKLLSGVRGEVDKRERVLDV